MAKFIGQCIYGIINLCLKFPFLSILVLLICVFFFFKDKKSNLEAKVEDVEPSPVCVYFDLKKEITPIEEMNYVIIGNESLDFIINDEKFTIKIDDIRLITLDLRARMTPMGTFGTEYIFDELIKVDTNNNSYTFIVKNKNELNDIFDCLQKLNISIIDEKNILESYKLYPNYYNRTKYYRYNHKDLMREYSKKRF